MRNQGVYAQMVCLVVMLLFAMTSPAQTVPEHLDSILKTLRLKEVVVKAKKVRQSGDTISYAASSYATKNDKVLEDLLRKMPGLEVTNDGQVKYNGQWINEFYIEGADMLGENYGVATRNIDANAIGAVQIIENHQAVKLLQGTQQGKAPAMNIKLKQTAKGVWSSILSAALGNQSKLAHDLSLSLMNFQRKSQNVSIYKTNDVGTDLRQEIHAPTHLNSTLGVGIMLPNKPSLSDAYSYRNNSHSVSVNQLYKLDQDRTLTFNANYLYDRERQNANDETSYLKNDGSRQLISESNEATCRNHFVGGHLVYKLNSRKSFLKDNFSIGTSIPKNEGLINEYIAQKLNGHSTSLSNKLQSHYKVKNGAVAEVKWNLSYDDKKGVLNVPNVGISQLIRERRFSTEAVTSLLSWKIPHLMFNLNGGFSVDWGNAIATLAETQDKVNDGEQKTWQLRTYLNPKVLLHFSNKFQWSIYVPIGVKYYKLDDDGWGYSKTYLSTTPYSSLSYKPSGHLAFDFTTICEESMPSALSLMVQKRYLNYRSMNSNPNQIESTRNKSLKLAFTTSYKDVIKMFFGGVTCSYVYAKNGNATGYDFVGDVINYIPLSLSVSSKYWQITQTASKGFFKWNSKISESFTLGSSRKDYYVSDARHEGRTDYLQVNLAYTASVAKFLSFNTSNDYSLSKPYTDGHAKNVKYGTYTNVTSLTLWPCK